MQLINDGRRRLRRAEPAAYSVDEAADLLGVSRNNAYQAVHDGVIPAKRVGRRWVIPRKAFHEWLESPDNIPEAV
ncbi:helix-turn-helix domain-containing protein [Nocardia otitidiscaviarum]|uniref:helix-turn-helix domain-containing protein n=1 Tax=Nocardia otitidiscaviarum TaxID=1823 RepID=UPI0024541769|nr:helix-turn-helix domain-containing protein [Nocardia otitidiscaviarum]